MKNQKVDELDTERASHILQQYRNKNKTKRKLNDIESIKNEIEKLQQKLIKLQFQQKLNAYDDDN